MQVLRTSAPFKASRLSLLCRFVFANCARSFANFSKCSVKFIVLCIYLVLMEISQNFTKFHVHFNIFKADPQTKFLEISWRTSKPAATCSYFVNFLEFDTPGKCEHLCLGKVTPSSNFEPTVPWPRRRSPRGRTAACPPRRPGPRGGCP